ncbi:MAG: M20 family metallopeptidase [Acidobacteriota bacterium]
MASIRSAPRRLDPESLRQQAPRIRDACLARRDAWIELCLELTRLESPSRDPASQEPVLALLATRLRAAGLQVVRWRGRRPAISGGGLLAHPPKPRPTRSPRQLLIGHCDTVWPLGTLTDMPARRDGALLRGPGIYDMKAGLAMIVTALEVLRQLDLEPPLLPMVLVNSDEEIGSHDSRTTLRRMARVAERVLVLEPSLGPEGRLKTARKGIGRFTVRVQGRAAHAGLDPEKGISAILELSHVIQKLFALNDTRRGITLNVGTVDGGLRTNVVAPESRAEIDVRVPTEELALEVERAIRALEPSLPGVVLEIDGAFGRPPMEPTPRNRRLWRLAAELADVLGLPLDEAMVGGGSDGNITSPLTATLDGLGAVGAGAHAQHEQVDIERTLERLALLTLLLLAPSPEEAPP